MRWTTVPPFMWNEINLTRALNPSRNAIDHILKMKRHDGGPLNVFSNYS